jgi:general secretion pathway protein G
MWCKTEAKRRTNGGFTLVELLLVVTILGILSAVVVMYTIDAGTEARIQATRASIAGVCDAIASYEMRNSRLPETIDDLTARVGGRPALLAKSNLNDAWGHAFQYRKLDRYTFEVRSGGVDEQMNTEDDLLNPQ